MQNNYYKFITQWQIAAPVNDVWYAIYESDEWPNWWKGVLCVKMISIESMAFVNIHGKALFLINYHLQ